MDPHLKPPIQSATFPLTQGTRTRAPNPAPPNDLTTDTPALLRSIRRPNTDDSEADNTPRVDPAQDGTKWSHHRHKHSKSRELRLPRPMSHLASSASARGLLPGWSSRDNKEREGEDGLLRPLSRETTNRSRWGSESTSGERSRRGSLLDNPEQNERLGPIQRREIRGMEDLERVRRRRKQGEGYLRSELAATGTRATELTRTLDYTYYNLLERITSLNSTISSFQDLSESASSLLADFERDTASLDPDIRKQISDLKGFEPQIELADALEKRMNTGRQGVEQLGKRLATVRGEIDRWEQREEEWQSRVSRRLRIFWTTVASALLVLFLGLIIQNWPSLPAPSDWAPDSGAGLNESAFISHPPESWSSVSRSGSEEATESSWYPASLAERRESLRQGSTKTDSQIQHGPRATAAENDPLRILDEL